MTMGSIFCIPDTFAHITAVSLPSDNLLPPHFSVKGLVSHEMTKEHSRYNIFLHCKLIV